MVVQSNPPLMEQFSIVNNTLCNSPATTTLFPGIPLIDLSKPDSKHRLVEACKEFGFFKVVNHRVPTEFIDRLETKAVTFFHSHKSLKEKAGPPEPFGYGNKKIGPNGDVGWVEYILLSASNHPQFDYMKLSCIPRISPEKFREAVDDYVGAVKRLACEILELMAAGVNIDQTDVFSKLLMDEQSDSVFRLNYYPPCPDEISGANSIGFGEHTDPQIISVLRSNNISGLQIRLQDGFWAPVPADPSSFYINVGDSLQVMTNGRFKSVRHRVLTNSRKSRLSMIYFGGPPLNEKISPLESVMEDGEESLYEEFTWSEYKKSAYKSRLADNRLALFQKITTS